MKRNEYLKPHDPIIILGTWCGDQVRLVAWSEEQYKIEKRTLDSMQEECWIPYDAQGDVEVAIATALLHRALRDILAHKSWYEIRQRTHITETYDGLDTDFKPEPVTPPDSEGPF